MKSTYLPLLAVFSAIPVGAQDGSIFKLDNKAVVEEVKPVEAAKPAPAEDALHPDLLKYEHPKEMSGAWMCSDHYRENNWWNEFRADGVFVQHWKNTWKKLGAWGVKDGKLVLSRGGGWVLVYEIKSANELREVDFWDWKGTRHKRDFLTIRRPGMAVDAPQAEPPKPAPVVVPPAPVPAPAAQPTPVPVAPPAPLPAAKPLDPRIQAKLDEVDADIAKADKAPDEMWKSARIVNLNAKLRIRENALPRVASKMRTATQAGDLELALAMKDKKARIEAEVERLKGEAETAKNGGADKKGGAEKNAERDSAARDDGTAKFLDGAWTLHSHRKKFAFNFSNGHTDSACWNRSDFVRKGSGIEFPDPSLNKTFLVKDANTMVNSDGQETFTRDNPVKVN